MPRMETRGGAVLLRLNALAYALLGTVLLLAPRRAVFDAFGLPRAEPELFTQIAGGLLIALAVLLWESPLDPFFERMIGRAAAISNAIGAALIPIWLASGDLDIPAKGTAVLWVMTIIMATFALWQLRYFRQRGPS